MKRPVSVLLSLAVAALVCAGGLALAFYEAPLSFADRAVGFHLWRQHVHGHYAQVDGYRIHYLEAVPEGKAGVPLVLIHGLGSKGEDWAPMIPRLTAAGFHVYAPDLLGYGRSPQPDVDYSIALQEKTVLDFMRTVGVAHADVGGWSMGGWVAMKLTIDHPESVDQLVVYDSAGIYFPATFDENLFTPEDGAGVQHLVNVLSPHPQPMPPFVERAVLERLQANGWVLHRSLRSMTSGRDLLDFQLSRIHKPTLVVWGTDDALIPLVVGQAIHRQIPGSSLLMVEGCGHLAPSECAAPIVRGTIDFLQAVPAGEPFEREVPATSFHARNDLDLRLTKRLLARD